MPYITPVNDSSTYAKFFTDGGEIRFSQLQENFGDTAPTKTDISISDYRRNISEDADWSKEPYDVLPRVPDAEENLNVSDDLNIKLSGYRNTLKEYNVTQTGSEKIEWIDSTSVTAQIWNGNLKRNVLKNLNITGTVYSNDVNKYALYIASKLSNFNLNVKNGGRIYGEGGTPGAGGSQSTFTYATKTIYSSKNPSTGAHTVGLNVPGGNVLVEEFEVWQSNSQEKTPVSKMEVKYEGGSNLGYAVNGTNSGVTEYSNFNIDNQSYEVLPVYQLKDSNTNDVAWSTNSTYNPGVESTISHSYNTTAIHRYYQEDSNHAYYLMHVCDKDDTNLPGGNTGWTDEGIVARVFDDPHSGMAGISFVHPLGFDSGNLGYATLGSQHRTEKAPDLTVGNTTQEYDYFPIYQMLLGDDVLWVHSISELQQAGNAGYSMSTFYNNYGIIFWAPSATTVNTVEVTNTVGNYSLDTSASNTNSSGIAYFSPRKMQIEVTTNVVNAKPGSAGGGALYIRNKYERDTNVRVYLEPGSQVFGGGGSGVSGNRGDSGSAISCSQWQNYNANNPYTSGNTVAPWNGIPGRGGNELDWRQPGWYTNYGAQPGRSCRLGRSGGTWVNITPNASRTQCRGSVSGAHGRTFIGPSRGDSPSGREWTRGGYQCSSNWTVHCHEHVSHSTGTPGGGQGGGGGYGQGYSRQSGSTSGNPGTAGQCFNCLGSNTCGSPGNYGTSGGTWGQDASGYRWGSKEGKGGHSIKWKWVRLESYSQGNTAKGQVSEWQYSDAVSQDFNPDGTRH